jgi:hypothetical protein
MFKDVERNIIYQKLSLFVLATDADGLDDIEKLYFINDEKNLYWEADQNSFSKPLLNNQTWIGLNSISMNDHSLLHKGDYRIVITDLGGETVERSVRIDYDDSKINDIIFPSVSIEKDLLWISGSSADYIIWVYDLNGTYIDLVYYTGKKIKASAIALKNQKTVAGYTFYVYTYEPFSGIGIVSGPFHFTKP